jgi:hypothetical protein
MEATRIKTMLEKLLTKTRAVDDFLDEVELVNEEYLEMVDNFLEKAFYGDVSKNKTISEYITDFYREDIQYTKLMSEKWIKEINVDVSKRLVRNYYLLMGVKGGFIRSKAPTTYDFMNISITKDKIIDLFILINGGYEPNEVSPTFEDWVGGVYTHGSYNDVALMARIICKREPELIGCRNVGILREKNINDILEKSELV